MSARPEGSTASRSTADESLADLLGGRHGAWDATLPPVAFVAGWLATGRTVGGGVAAALLVTAGIVLWRLFHAGRPRAVVLGALGVCAGAMIALATGRAADFFLLQLASNGTSAIVWVASILVRWPLLGVVVGLALGQRLRWRRDPALLRAYSRGSWVWVAQYTLRLAVFLPLWYGGQVVALGVARAALTWPLIAACLAGSWLVVRRALPEGHPGLRHPQAPNK